MSSAVERVGQSRNQVFAEEGGVVGEAVDLIHQFYGTTNRRFSLESVIVIIFIIITDKYVTITTMSSYFFS